MDTPPSHHETNDKTARMRRSRRSYLALCTGASVATLSGCVSIPSVTNDEPDPEPTEDPTLDPDAFTISREFYDERSAAGVRIPGLDEDEASWDELAGTVSIDTSQRVNGRQSLRLETGRAEEQAAARFTFEEPRDFDGQSFSVAVNKEAPPETWNQVSLILRDGSGEWIQFSQTVEAIARADWQRFDLGVNEISGDPDLSSINSLEVWTWVKETASRIFIDDIRTTETANTSYVLIHFDDILEGAYTNAFPILEEYGFLATGGTIVHKIGTDRYMSQVQLDELADSGWEFCSHPHADETFAEMDSDRLASTLAEYKAWHEEHGFDDGLEYIIYPFGEVSDASLEVIADYHKIGFKVPQQGYGARVTSPLLCGRVNGEEYEKVTTAIDLAEAYNCVVPIMYHDIGADGTYDLSTETFERSMDYINEAHNVEVITTGEWVSMLSTGEFE